jgi:transcriptional regulator with XRE-family HTH domain
MRVTLRKARHMRGMNQQQLAAVAGITQGRISQLETRGESCTPDVRRALSEALKVGEDDLLLTERPVSKLMRIVRRLKSCQVEELISMLEAENVEKIRLKGRERIRRLRARRKAGIITNDRGTLEIPKAVVLQRQRGEKANELKMKFVERLDVCCV